MRRGIRNVTRPQRSDRMKNKVGRFKQQPPQGYVRTRGERERCIEPAVQHIVVRTVRRKEEAPSLPLTTLHAQVVEKTSRDVFVALLSNRDASGEPMRRGEARRGEANPRQGKARQGKARQGKGRANQQNEKAGEETKGDKRRGEERRSCTHLFLSRLTANVK